MTLKFSSSPGCRERDLQRRNNNPLYTEAMRSVDATQLEEAQKADAQELKIFSENFRALFEKASTLEANVQSDVILGLKQSADQLYEQASGLAGDNSQAQEALLKFIHALMNAVRAGAANDPKALSELEQETEARSMHMSLLKFPLIADLLRPDSLIDAESLAAALLSCESEELSMTLQLFDPEQILSLQADAQSLLEICREAGNELPDAWQRLQQISDAS